MKVRLLALIASIIFVVSAQGQIVKGYFPYYRSAAYVNNVNYDKLTDVIYAFASLDGSGNLAIMGDINVFNALKTKCATENVRLWVAIGGWNLSGNFSPVAANTSLRNNLATQCLNLCNTHGLAGIDIDWEFPASGDAANFTAMLAAIKGQLGTTYKLSAALGGESFSYSCVNGGHAVGVQAAAFTHLDYFNIMSYDAPGCFSNHTSVDFTERSMDGWNAKGCPYSKMIVGAAFYSRGAGEMMWSDIANTTRFNDADGIESGYTFDSKPTIIAKANMAICTKGAAGMMTWELSQDVAPANALNLTAVMYDAVMACSCPFSDPNLGADQSLCGLPGQITLNPGIATNSPSRTFTWKKNGTTVVNASTTQNTYVTTGAGTYEVTIVQGSCTKTESIIISATLPTPALGTDKVLCSPSHYTLSPSNLASFPAGTTWEWSQGSTVIGTNSSLTFVRTAGTYRLTASISGCSSTFDEIGLTSSQPTPNDACIASAGVANLSISNLGAGPYSWYNNATGGSSLTSGATYNPTVSSTDTFWVQEGTGSSYYVGPTSGVSGEDAASDSKGFNFTVSNNTISLVEVDVYIPNWTNTTNILVKILNSAGSSTLFTSAAVSYNNQAGSPYKLVVPVGASLAPGSYKLVVNSTGNLVMGTGNAFPYTNNDVSITSAFGITYPFALNWKIGGGSACGRLGVIARVAGGCSVPAPVTLSAFDVIASGSDAQISWTTSSEINNDYFAVQRSSDGVNFTQIGIVDGAGNSSTIRNYNYTDAGLAGGTWYYRLAQHDFNSDITLSTIKSVTLGTVTAILPNPFSGSTQIKVSGDGIADFKILDLSGRVLEEVKAHNVHQPLEVGAQLPTGIYLLEVMSNNQQSYYRLFKQ